MNRGYLGWAATMIIACFRLKVQSFLQIFSPPTKRLQALIFLRKMLLLVMIAAFRLCLFFFSVAIIILIGKIAAN